MAKRGPKPTPRAKKEARGTVQPCRDSAAIVEFPNVDTCPDAPAFLNEYGVDLWERVAPSLYAQKILTIADLPALEIACHEYGTIRDMIDRRIEIPASKVAQMRLMLAEFGMTPSSRQRVSPAGPGKSENPFTRNGSKPGRDHKAPAD